VTVTYGLDTYTQRAAFVTYRTEFESGNASGLNPDFFESLATESSESTGRRMRIQNVEYRTNATENRGSLTLAFTWTHFLERPDRDTLRFHDALLVSDPNPEGRLWLSTLDENQTMTIRTPPGYSVNTTQAPSFEFENNSVVIEGPQEFDGDLTIAYQRTAPTGDTGDTADTLRVFVAGAAVPAVVIVVAAYVLRRRDDRGPSTAGSANEGEPGAAAGQPPDGSDDEGDGDPADGDDGGDTVDLSLLSDEERVERLLERNGGRMKQATIVRETGWSDAKVSQLLSSMADEGRVEKLRLGRENLISLPDDDEE
jgi:hypothetical protein